MKFLFSTLIFISVSCYLQAQKLSYTKRAAISALNDKAKETIGNIRVFSSGSKATIEDASFTATETGVKMEVVLMSPSNTKVTFTSEFNPADITYITETAMPDKSPIGQMEISLNYKIGYKTSNSKTNGFKQTYEDAMTFNFLKVEKGNFLEIQTALFKLKELYINEDNEPLRPLAKAMNKNKDFWISSEGTSNTYELSRVYVTGCTMRMVYYLQSIGTSNEVKQMYITIVPLSEIDDVRLDKSKSKPNCIMLEAGKKGFETYELKDKIYVPSRAVKEIPLFVDVSYDFKRDEVMEILKTQVKECGGGKIKL